MNAHRRRPGPPPQPRAQRGAASPWIFAGFLAVAAFFYFTEHRAHLMGALPFVLLALCPLMHLFHHRHGHGRGAGADRGDGASADDNRVPPSSHADRQPPSSH